MSGTVIGKVDAHEDCGAVSLIEMVDGRLLLCQGEPGSKHEQIIDLTKMQAIKLKRVLFFNLVAFETDYDVISSIDPHDLMRQVNTKAGSGWELVSVTCESPVVYGKPAHYCAFIRRRDYGR